MTPKNKEFNMWLWLTIAYAFCIFLMMRFFRAVKSSDDEIESMRRLPPHHRHAHRLRRAA
jgi:hypothetical protein